MHLILLVLLLAAPLAVQAQTPLQTVSVTPPAQLLHEDDLGPLLPQQPVTGGDTLRTGPHGSAGLQLGGDSVFTLDERSVVFIHSLDEAVPGRGPLLRLQLLTGALELDAYPASNRPPHDYRINLGPLRLRALGADLWAYVGSLGEGVCLHQGALEITGEVGAQRLDRAGDCVQHDAGADGLRLLPQGEAELKARLLAARAAPPQAAAPSPAASPPDAVTPPAPRHWSVALATLADRPGAERVARRLKAEGLDCQVEAATAPGTYRVVTGTYASRMEAAQAAERLRQRHRLKHVGVFATP